MITAFISSACKWVPVKKNERKRQGERKRIDRERKKCGTGCVCLRFLLNGCQQHNALQQKIRFSQFVDSWQTVNFTELPFAKQQVICSVIQFVWVFKRSYTSIQKQAIIFWVVVDRCEFLNSWCRYIETVQKIISLFWKMSLISVDYGCIYFINKKI